MFNGIKEDLNRRLPHYLSDYTDGNYNRCLCIFSKYNGIHKLYSSSVPDIEIQSTLVLKLKGQMSLQNFKHKTKDRVT